MLCDDDECGLGVSAFGCDEPATTRLPPLEVAVDAVLPSDWCVRLNALETTMTAQADTIKELRQELAMATKEREN